MSFLQRLFGGRDESRSNPLEDPSRPLTAGVLNSVFNWAMGGSVTTSGEVVSEFSAMQHVTVYACVRALAEAVGSLTLRTYTRQAKGRSEAVQDPLWRLLSLTPNDEMPASVMWENVVGSMALTGNSYLEILRIDGQVFQLYPLNPLKTEPVRLPSPSSKLAYKTTSGSASGTARIINAEDVLHFRLFSYDGLKGLSPVQQCKQTIGWSTGALKSSARFFGSGSKPPGILTPVGTVNDGDLSNFRKAWELANGGDNQGRTAVLPSDWKFTPIGISAKDAQFLESMQFSRADICAIFRLPPHMAGDTSRLSNNNVESQNLGFVLDTLRPYLVKIEQEIAIKLLNADPARFVEFDVSERLRGDFKTTMDAFAVGRQWGIFSANDCLEQLGKNPIPGPEGSITWAPVNMQDASRLLITESIQDQPVNQPAVNEAEPVNDAKPAEPIQARSFAKYTPAFLSLYKDAVGRLVTRSKRDIDTVTSILAPVVKSITELAETDARSQFKLDESWHVSDKCSREYLKSVSTRSTTWGAEARDTIAGEELGKCIRAVVFTTFREAGAAVAERGLSNE
jgi:HK97 family phage portal protein